MKILKKLLEPKHVTSLIALFILAISTGVITVQPEYTKYIAFIIGALGMFGYGIPKGYEIYIPSTSKFPKIRKKVGQTPTNQTTTDSGSEEIE